MLFHLPAVLSANPHWYDYAHFLEFQDDNSVRMIDGGGQVINAEVRAKFIITNISENTAKIGFTEVKEYDPYEKDQKVRDLRDFTSTVTREEGMFAFKRESVWKITNPDQHPCLLYRIRHIFDIDPLALVAANQWGNLYHMTEKKDFTNSVHFYYLRDDEQVLSLSELRELNIAID